MDDLLKQQQTPHIWKYIATSILLYIIAKGGLSISGGNIALFLIALIAGVLFYIAALLTILLILKPFIQAKRIAGLTIFWLSVLAGYLLLITRFPEIRILHPIAPEDFRFPGTSFEVLWFVVCVLLGWEQSTKLTHFF